MRLTRLEIKGFKSFADKTVINFSENVIGIVGPNGCGKSNIVDSIRWVLGEQKSKELRSDKMENVLFNGTKDRKQSGLAEVALTFENTKNILPTEYNMVTIKRMLYRTGESEYRINDVKCRLKDITSLLADTGMGSDSYAIIALGMVDEILSDNDDSRRKLFEQAAGITKYKARKKETLQKLESAEADLARVEDLLFEIDANLKVLEKQAKRAKKYFELKAEYREASIELAILELAGMKNTYKELETKIKQEEDKRAELDMSLGKADAKLEKDKALLLEKERSLSEQQRDVNSLVGKIRGLENDKKMLAQRDLFVQENSTKLVDRVAQAEIKREQLLDDLEKYSSSLAEEQEVLKVLLATLEVLKEKSEQIKAGHSHRKGEMDNLISEQQTLEKQLFELEKKKAVTTSRSENLKRDIQYNQEVLQRKESEHSSVQERATELKELQLDTEERLENLKIEEVKRLEKIADLEKQSEKLRDEFSKTNRSLDAKRNEYRLTKSMVDNLEGFPESIRYLSKESAWKSKAPLLSDIIYTKEDYRTAIENFLEPYLNYYVVTDLEEAMQAIYLLDQAQRGKANFFILNEIKKILEPPLENPAFISALEVTQTDPPYQKLVNYLLANVYIGEDIDAESLDENVVLLNKSGTFLKKKYAAGGGSVGLFEGKRIGRQKNLEILDAEIKTTEKFAEELGNSLEQIKEQIQQAKNNTQERTIQEVRSQLDRTVRDFVTLRAQLDSFEQFKRDTEHKIKQFNDEIFVLEGEIHQINNDYNTLQATLAVVKEKISHADNSFREVAEQLSSASSAYNQQNIEVIKQQNKISGIEREVSYQKRQLEDLTRQIQTDNDSLSKTDSELNSVRENIQAAENQLADLYAQRKNADKSLTDVEQNYYALRGDLNKQEEELRQYNRRRQDSLSLWNELQTNFNNLKLQLTSINERMKIEFDVRVNELINLEAKEDSNQEVLTVLTASLKNKLQNYGEINHLAVEAFNEMKERFDFITAQRKDLFDAKVSLMDTINEIQSKATTQYLSAFTQVREHFQNVFRSLFTEEDTCDLVLMDPSNPLESDISIIAKPKGKRPLSINQLSGGEKTLTATALLFSLYLLKPAPFCIFDEVDAPLDDSNIAKFNKIIQKFSDNSQFIIVTHNKQTMASVDIIYGVTMQKLGVSEVVPVDFRELNGD